MIFRSALVPGWGHIYAKKPIFGYTYLTTFSALTLSSQNLYVEMMDARKKYQLRGLLLLPALYMNKPTPEITSVINYNLSKNYFDKTASYNRSINLLTVAYCLQLLHVFYTASRYKPDPTVNISYFINSERMVQFEFRNHF